MGCDDIPESGGFRPWPWLSTRAHQREAQGQVRPQDRVPAGVVDGLRRSGSFLSLPHLGVDGRG